MIATRIEEKKKKGKSKFRNQRNRERKDTATTIKRQQHQ
jgi:hypothetical protein